MYSANNQYNTTYPVTYSQVSKCAPKVLIFSPMKSRNTL